MSRLILPAGMGMATPEAQVSLEKRAEEFQKGKIRSYALVTVMTDGTPICDYDLKTLNSKELGMIGAALEQMYIRFSQMQREAFERERMSTPEELARVTGMVDDVARYAKNN